MGTRRTAGFDSRRNNKTKETGEINWYNSVEKEQRMNTKREQLIYVSNLQYRSAFSDANGASVYRERPKGSEKQVDFSG